MKENAGYWYYGYDIKKIIKADKIGKGYDRVNISVDATYYSDVTLYPNKPPKISLNYVEPLEKTVWINIAPEISTHVSANNLQEGIASTVQHLLNQENAAPLPRTFIFQANVGNNHWATYACNTNGEIMIINSLGGVYKEWDDAAIAGFREALKGKAKAPIEITPRQDQGFEQEGESACGPITVAMSCAIDGKHSFAEQKDALEREMKNICKGDGKKSYETLREKHRNLVGLINGMDANKKPTDDQKAAIIAEVAKPNYPRPDVPLVDNRPDDSKDIPRDDPKNNPDPSASQKSQQQESQVQQNGKKIHLDIVEDSLGKICQKEGLSFVGSNGKYVVKDQGKKIHVEVSKEGKLSATTNDSEMLEKMIKMFAEKMDKFGEKPRELILKGDPRAMQIMKEACAKYNITVVDPNSQQNKKPDDIKKQPEKSKEAKLKIPTEATEERSLSVRPSGH